MVQSKTRRALMATSAITVTTALFAAAGYAQNAGTTQIETVVVTAQKYAEPLSKAALAISTINQSGLDKLSITTAQELVTTVPNLQTFVSGYNTQYSIRGIGNMSGTYATVATQIDGIYQPTAAALNNGLYDVNRVEVARGPQGTVYGRNATAGIVNIITADPTKEFQLFGDVAVGSYSDITARAVANIPITDHIQVRASVVRERNDGYFNRGVASRDYDATDILTAQLTTLVEFTDSLTWRMAFEHAENTGTLNYLAVANYLYYPDADPTTGTLGSPVIAPGRDNLFNQESQKDNSISTQLNALRSRLTWAATDSITLTYLAGYSTFVDNGYDNATYTFNLWQRGTITRSMVHELDFNYESDALKFVAGLYYYWENTPGNGAINIGNTVPWPLSSVVSTIYTSTLNNPVGNEPSSYGLIDIMTHTVRNNAVSKAAFAQATYSILENLRLTGGLRYTKDQLGYDAWQQVCAFGTAGVPSPSMSCLVPYGPPSLTSQSVKSDNISWKASIDYDLAENQLVYGTVSTGYRGGGVSGNASLPEQYQTYKPEKAMNYEIGWKGQFFDRSLGLNLALFNMQYKNMQVYAIEHDLSGTPTPVTVNAATARVQGAELEWIWRATPADQIQGYVTYLDAHFTSFPNAVNSSVNPDGIYNTVAAIYGYPLLPTDVATDFAGKRLPNAPMETFRLSYSHVFDLGSEGTLTPSIQVYWQAKTYNDLANSVQAIREAYTKSDFNLIYQSASERLTVDFYVHNLENSKIWQVANAKWDQTAVMYYPPRTYGIRVGYKLY